MLTSVFTLNSDLSVHLWNLSIARISSGGAYQVRVVESHQVGVVEPYHCIVPLDCVRTVSPTCEVIRDRVFMCLIKYLKQL